MKEHIVLTRKKVDVDPSAVRYMGETHLME